MNFVSTYMRYSPSSSHVSKSYTARKIEPLLKLSSYWKLYFKTSLVDVYLLMNKARGQCRAWYFQKISATFYQYISPNKIFYNITIFTTFSYCQTLLIVPAENLLKIGLWIYCSPYVAHFRVTLKIYCHAILRFLWSDKNTTHIFALKFW